MSGGRRIHVHGLSLNLIYVQDLDFEQERVIAQHRILIIACTFDVWLSDRFSLRFAEYLITCFLSIVLREGIEFFRNLPPPMKIQGLSSPTKRII